MTPYQIRALWLFPLLAIAIFGIARAGDPWWTVLPSVAVILWFIWRS